MARLTKTVFRLTLILALAPLSGCAQSIYVKAGPQATAALCGNLLLDTPETLAGLPRQKTTSQATTAWGKPGAAITLTCGAKPAEPSAGDCQSISARVRNTAVTLEWIAQGNNENGWQFTTFGTQPTVVVQVPPSIELSQPSAVLVDLAPALSQLPVNRNCV